MKEFRTLGFLKMCRTYNSEGKQRGESAFSIIISHIIITVFWKPSQYLQQCDSNLWWQTETTGCLSCSSRKSQKKGDAEIARETTELSSQNKLIHLIV